MSEEPYRPDEDYEPESAAAENGAQQYDEASFADRVNEAIGEGVADLAVADLIQKVAERTNELQTAQHELSERTADLQRLQAEFVNYKRRIERDRQQVVELAQGKVIGELLGVLDDIGRARDHGELEGGFRRVAESLESVLTKMGLEQFGATGEQFDPNLHEALMHQSTDELEPDTVAAVLQPGYRFGERVLRVARVAVAQPGDSD
ncbi:nucleotide exchange factor GrpE [Actinospica acidithermotolerans]|uniref:nucleotide exchange factor GrpE n=1 Tax=Actinospica acidithermotolerans TaxID=2828514 RepID=UPI0027DACF34|nr:nucleotide exchange factor GrpE [Actinospica acidithermotolerans]